MTILVNAYSTLRQPPPLDFSHQLVGHRDADDLELRSHLNGFMGFVYDQGNREMTATLYAVMRHIDRVRHQFSFEIEEGELEGLSNWGWNANSILFLPDGSVRDPAGAVLVDPASGLAQNDAVVPYPQDAHERSQHSDRLLNERGIPALSGLPPVVGEGEVVLRSADDVAWRIQSLFIVAVRAESVAMKKPISAAQLRAKSPLAFEAMSPAETAFVNHPNPDEIITVQFAWRYESLYTLQWALSLHDALKFADDICDVPLVAETMIQRTSREMILDAKLRDTEEILDALDFNGRMFWAARQSKIDGRAAPAGIDGDVLCERQHALNWLVSFGGFAWDEVDTPT